MLLYAKEKGLPQEYVEWGEAMVTTAVFAIIITAPLGAIMINTLGEKWMDYDGHTDEVHGFDSDGKAEGGVEDAEKNERRNTEDMQDESVRYGLQSHSTKIIPGDGTTPKQIIEDGTSIKDLED